MVPNDPEYRIEVAAALAATWWHTRLAEVEDFQRLGADNLLALRENLERAICAEWETRFPRHTASWAEDIPPVRISCGICPGFFLGQVIASTAFPDGPIRFPEPELLEMKWKGKRLIPVYGDGELDLKGAALVARLLETEVGNISMRVQSVLIEIDEDNVRIEKIPVDWKAGT